jgi:hypothetical protein|tara:strand:+ start:144 stop:2348 length:2205 start_codon:yes stop_codon:yes gene_type:complete
MYNTTIAKLLAKENIEVQYGNYKTAWFDIESRTLGLPLWKDMGKDVHDLLVGHEVGHALYTPYEGWHDSPTNVEKLLGCPRSYINVVEDARIEKKIRSQYPGLVGPMARGYKVLADEEFFGDISDVDFDQVKLIDKINLKAKLQNLIEVPFNPAEAFLFNKTMNTESFEEVIDVVKAILAYTQDHTPELIQQPEPQPEEDTGSEEENTESEDSSGHDDYQKPEPKKEDSGDESSEEEEEESDDAGESDDEDSGEDDTEEEVAHVASKDPEHNEDEDVSLTDMMFRDSEERLLEQDKHGDQTLLGRDRGKDTIKSTVISYSDLKIQRAQNAEIYGVHDDILEGYKSYTKEVKKTVQVAVKEFEMKKAAFQWQRAASAKTGQLNTDMAYAYKTSDDIFKRVTHLADAKNHGMIMVIDYSGSMMSTMHNVLDQLIHLTTFCKAINIPFDVYAFTTGGWREDRNSDSWKTKDGEVDMDELKMPHLISSTFKKAQFEEAIQALYKKMVANKARNNRWDSEDYKPWDENAYTGKNEEYGSTPLDQALIVTHHIVKEFRAKHNIDKMNVAIISDGDSNNLNVARSYKNADNHASTKSSYANGMKILIDRKITNVTGYRSNATKCLLESLQKRYGVTTLGFFIAQDSSDWRSKIDQITHWGDRKDLNRQYNKNKVAIMDNTIGYDKFFLLKGGKNLEVQSNDMDEMINEEMNTAQIRAGFKKFAKGKKNSKVLMKQIGGVIA